ncbi:hypothetical protein HN014_16585 [Aquimarina sp. TRL1]|uniref:hypothetical protein n=1 Tax=Aquimarina sp. (strain TRL1) TaxID=2736252 RepID=UPI00158924D0|nr:hypothetical protein [Aquimarina sp. TRL1]QKX06461.1 hypothetical protein HN014_16585 [Aquimarina sp. TRL1]
MINQWKALSFRSLLFAILFSNWLYPQHKDRTIEDITLSCVYEAFTKGGVDLKKELESYEAFLVQNNFLKNKSGKEYIAFLQEMNRINYIPATRPNALFIRLLEADFKTNYDKDCVLKKVITEGNFSSLSDFKNTKLHRLEQAVKKVMYRNEADFKTISKVHLDILDESDYEKPYFKTMFLLSIALGSNEEGHEVFEKLPPLPDN